jgi:GNAT superfamily N-acetyltransferase
VATSSQFLGAGAAGVYFVFTFEQARRRGVGAALTLAPPKTTREMGYRIGVLGSSEMGFPVYRRLGFREHCRIGICEWTVGRPPSRRRAPPNHRPLTRRRAVARLPGVEA